MSQPHDVTARTRKKRNPGLLNLLLVLCVCLAPASLRASASQIQSPSRLAVHAEADFDGDGILDRAWLSPASAEIGIRFSRVPLRRIRLREPAWSLAVVDLDRDGDLDIVAMARASRIQVWLNGGSGEFRLGAVAPKGRLASTVARLAADAAYASASPVVGSSVVFREFRAQDWSLLVEPSVCGASSAFSACSSRAPPGCS